MSIALIAWLAIYSCKIKKVFSNKIFSSKDLFDFTWISCSKQLNVDNVRTLIKFYC